MVKGLYTAYTGMINEQRRMDVLTNNLANANTVGYKKEGSVAQSFSDMLGLKIKDMSEAPNTPRREGILNLGVKIGETYTDWSQGPMRLTNETYDLALSGRGFFTIEYTNKAVNVERDQPGQTTIMYTRDGNFTLTTEGELVTRDGDFVLDTNGNHIVLDPNTETEFNPLGQIYQNGNMVAQLQITDFEDYNALSHYGENMWEPVDEAVQQPAAAQVRAGYLEMSNVSVVDEMVNMIAVQRNYDANQTMITTIDEKINTVVSQVGRLQ